MKDGEAPDFFISYNHRDEGWATWIAWVLEDAHYSVVIQAWDFRPGNNFVLEMQRAAERAKRTIAVLSTNYFGSDFVKPEWAAAFGADPTGVRAQLIPVRIEDCVVPGMLSQVNYIDLVGLDKADAAARLLAGVQPGRAKPLTPPPFPGIEEPLAVTPSFPREGQRQSLDWRVLDQPGEVQWHESFASYRPSSIYGRSTIEGQMVAVPAQRLAVRQLESLATKMIDLGRKHGLFTASEQVERMTTDQVAMAHTPRLDRDRDFTGVMVTRSGQRGFWLALPYDGLGSAFDRADVATRVRPLLDLLLALPIPLPEAIAVAARVEPVSMLQIASPSALGSRNTASFPYMTATVRPVLPEDAVSATSLQSNRAEFVDEVVARLEATLRTGR